MLSMWKLLATLFLVSSFFVISVSAKEEDYSKTLETFLKSHISKNPNVISLDVKVVGSKDLNKPKGWKAYMVSFKGKAKVGKDERPISQSSVYFVKDGMLATELIDLKTGAKLNDTISDTFAPHFKEEFYAKANLIYGNENAKHKVAIFSDPLCPFCKAFVPGALEYLKKYPKDFAVYYYHMPLAALHPASPTICKALIALQLKGHEDAILKVYRLKLDYKETNEQKILDAVNAGLGTNITLKDINSLMVQQEYKADEDIASAMMVNGTPTVFFDGLKDTSKTQYMKVKVQK